MFNYISLLEGVEVSFSEYDIYTTDKFKNISGTDLIAKFKELPYGVKHGSHFLRTKLKTDFDGNLLSRNNENIEKTALLMIIDADKSIDMRGTEIDGAPDPYQVSRVLKKLGIGYIIYGTYSYYVGEVGYRYRIILICNKSYFKEQLEPTARYVVELINSNLTGNSLAYAKENHSYSQGWNFARQPQSSTKQPLYFEYLEGNAIEVFEPVKINIKTTTQNKRQDIGGKISPLDYFNDQIDIRELLKGYGYKFIRSNTEIEKWLSPESTSGEPGITVKDNKLFSHHNDQLNDGYHHGSFDLMRIREGLSLEEATIKAAKSTFVTDGRTVYEYNQSIISNKDNTSKITFKEYKPFDENLLPIEKVPYEVLPKVMGQFIREQSEIRSCPDDYVLISLLARMGAVFSGKIQIKLTRNTNWCAYPNFFWAMIGKSSSGKNNGLSSTNEPIKILVAEAKKQYKEAYKQYSIDKEIIEIKINSMKKSIEQEYKKSKIDHGKINILESSFNDLKMKLQNLEEQRPRKRQYIINKITVEKLLLILPDNPYGIMLEIDELASFFVKLSKDEHADERGLYLSGYTGTIHYDYLTIKHGSVTIPILILSIFGGIQPSKLKRFLNEARTGYHDDGMLQRFQGVVYPDKYSKPIEDKCSSEYLRGETNNLFYNLDNLSSEIILEFDDEAQSIFDAYREETMEIAKITDHPLDAHISKSIEFVASLASYLCLFENKGLLPDENKITVGYVVSAIKLGEYFLSHAKRMYGLAYKDNLPARSLSEKMITMVTNDKFNSYFDKKVNMYAFTRSDFRSKDWSDLTNKEQRLEAIKVLVERGHISEPINGKYYINPEHLKE